MQLFSSKDLKALPTVDSGISSSLWIEYFVDRPFDAIVSNTFVLVASAADTSKLMDTFGAYGPISVLFVGIM